MRIPALVPELLDRQRAGPATRRRPRAPGARTPAHEQAARGGGTHRARQAGARREGARRCRGHRIGQGAASCSSGWTSSRRGSRRSAAAESQARGAAEESRAGLARVGVLESRLAELQSSRAQGAGGGGRRRARLRCPAGADAAVRHGDTRDPRGQRLGGRAARHRAAGPAGPVARGPAAGLRARRRPGCGRRTSSSRSPTARGRCSSRAARRSRTPGARAGSISLVDVTASARRTRGAATSRRRGPRRSTPRPWPPAWWMGRARSPMRTRRSGALAVDRRRQGRQPVAAAVRAGDGGAAAAAGRRPERRRAAPRDVASGGRFDFRRRGRQRRDRGHPTGARIVTVRDVTDQRRADDRDRARAAPARGPARPRAAHAHAHRDRGPGPRARAGARAHGQRAGVRLPRDDRRGPAGTRRARQHAAEEAGQTLPMRWRGPPPADSALLGMHDVAACRESPGRGGHGHPAAGRVAGLACAPARDADPRWRPPRRRPAAREQAGAIRRRGPRARRAGCRCALEGAAPPAFGRRDRERHGSHGARDAGRDRDDRRALGIAGRLQDRSREARRGARGRHRHGHGPARAHGARAARHRPADRRRHAAHPARDPLAPGHARRGGIRTRQDARGPRLRNRCGASSSPGRWPRPCASTTSDSTARVIRAGSRATRSCSKRASSRSPTPSRRCCRRGRSVRRFRCRPVSTNCRPRLAVVTTRRRREACVRLLRERQAEPEAAAPESGSPEAPMHLQFFGAAGEVTGSCHILDVGGRRILLDCGLIQGGVAHGERNREPFPFDAAGIDAVILSHAHIDHCGRLPLLHKRGFRGPVHATAACRDLARILLARLRRRSPSTTPSARSAGAGATAAGAAVEPLYTAGDAEAVLRSFRSDAVRAGRRGAARRRAHVPGRGTHPGVGERLPATDRGRSRAAARLQRRPRPVRLAHPARPRGRARRRRWCSWRAPTAVACTAIAEATLAEFGEILRQRATGRRQRAHPGLRRRAQPGRALRVRHALRGVAARRLADLPRQPDGDRGVAGLLAAHGALR